MKKKTKIEIGKIENRKSQSGKCQSLKSLSDTRSRRSIMDKNEGVFCVFTENKVGLYLTSIRIRILESINFSHGGKPGKFTIPRKIPKLFRV